MKEHIIALLVHFAHWFMTDVAPWVIASLVPTVIAGLSRRPEKRGLIPAVQALARVLGWATHRNDPGTFKFPLQEVLSGMLAVVRHLLRGRGTPAAAVLLLVAIGCGTDGAARRQVFTANWKDCTIANIPGELNSAVVGATSALFSDDWRGGLAQLGTQLGGQLVGDQLKCVVQAAVASLRAQAAEVRGVVDPKLKQAIDRGELWLSDEQVRDTSYHMSARELTRRLAMR